MKWARIVEGEVFEVIDIDPTDRFHSDIMAQIVEAPDNVTQRSKLNADGTWDIHVPPPPVPDTPPPRKISSDEVRKALTLTERVKWDAGKLDEVVTVKLEFASPRSVEDAKELLDFLVASGVISQISADKVLL